MGVAVGVSDGGWFCLQGVCFSSLRYCRWGVECCEEVQRDSFDVFLGVLRFPWSIGAKLLSVPP